MQLVQTLLTTDQTSKVEQALKLVTQRAEDLGIVWSSENEENEYLQLAGFFQALTETPEQFRPKGEMARTVRSIVKRVKGPSQPPSGKRKRSQGQQKRDRKAARELAEQYNAARERVEQDMQEAREAAQEQIASRQERITVLLQSIKATDSEGYAMDELAELLELIGADGVAAQAKALANTEA